MTLSDHLVKQFEEDKKPIIPPHLRAGMDQQAGGSRPGRPNPVYVKQEPDESWYSHHGNSTTVNRSGAQSQWSEEKIAHLQARLARKLGPEFVTQRPGPGGGPKLSYIEGWKVINLANEVFGFDGWSSSISQLSVDYLDVNKDGRCSVNVTAIVRITLKDGCFHEDVGCGQGENQKSKGAALDKAKKEAVTDATKRALKTFGNLLGNCLYDKQYTAEVVKMRVPPTKFNPNELERRPEFAPPPQQQHQPDAGPSRPQQPAPTTTSNAAPAAQAIVPPAPPSPLRTVEEADMSDFNMEVFDGEFLDAGGESFYDIVDQPAETTAIKAQTSAAPPLNAMPPYQHRQRPEAPAAGGPSREFARVASSDAAARRLSAIMAAEGKTPDVGASDKHTSSGGSSTTLAESAKQAVGGFAYPNKPTATGGGSSARALAIQSALNQNQGQRIERSESPRIPAGGIDAVAAKATTNMKTYGTKLQLDEEMTLVDSPGNPYTGFASARGMKRVASGDERGRLQSHSPTKPGGARQALGELPIDRGGGDYGAKRARP